MEENKELLEAVQDAEEVDQISNEVAGEYPTVEEATEIIEGPSEDITKTDIEVTEGDEAIADNSEGTEEVVEEAAEEVSEEIAEESVEEAAEDSEPEAEVEEEISEEVVEESQLDRIEKLLNEVLKRLGYSEEDSLSLEDSINIVDDVNEDNSALLNILDKLDEEGGNDYE